MANKILKLITAAVLLAAVMILTTSCSAESNYDRLDKNGYTVSVTFDPGVGQINSTNSTVTDSFNPADYTPNSSGKIEIPLLAPDDARRDKNNVLKLSNPSHFLAGWYTERTPIDPSDLSKGYTYSGKWDFESDRLTLDPNGEYTSSVSQLTLYAAWIPYFNYEIYAEDKNGDWKIISTQEAINLNVPVREEGDVTIDMGNFPKRAGYTLEKVYLDPECTVAATERVSGKWSTETGTAEESTIKLYTKWLDGEHFYIYTADDLRKNADANGHYHIMADLDFTKVKWHNDFAKGKFSGAFYGGGHKISGVSVTSDRNGAKVGLFGEITEKAVFENITFENVTHTFDTGIVNPDTCRGLLAGVIAEGASFTDVSISGKILLGDGCQNLKDKADNYTIGLVCAGQTPVGISASITCEKKNPENDRLTFTLEVSEDGIVTLVFPD